MYKISLTIITLFLSIVYASAKDGIVHIAVASNFSYTLQKISTAFSKKTGYSTLITSASTGTLYTQIKQGAPFDIFLSADVLRAKKLENELDNKNGRFTYAIGTLALYYPSGKKEVSKYTLNSENIKYISIAKPSLAPYGFAAKETLIHMNLWKWKKKQGSLLMGNSVSQAFNFISNSKNVAGFVALSQLIKQKTPKNRYWIVPSDYYSPIKQQAILLNNSPESLEFMEFLKTEEAIKIIKADGYKTESSQ